jgi:transposase
MFLIGSTNRAILPVLWRWGGRPLRHQVCQSLVVANQTMEPPEMELMRIGVDTSKHVFTVHGVDASGAVVLRRDLRRGAFETFMSKLAPTEVALEACGGSHHWARRLATMGHQVRLIPPQYVKPYVKRSKTDRADAEAICEAAGRPSMRFVPVKTAERQGELMVLRTRELLVRQRTQAVNALRGHATEFGLVVPLGVSRVEELLAKLAADPGVPVIAREMLAVFGRQIEQIDTYIADIDVRLLAMHKANDVSQRLARVPGIGPITAISLALNVEAAQFESGRHLAAWLGLTPRAHSSGGKQRLGGISRAGNERLRQLLVVGATAVIRHASKPGARLATPWLTQLLARKPRKLAAVALANKTARIVWAMMARGETYRVKPLVAVPA